MFGLRILSISEYISNYPHAQCRLPAHIPVPPHLRQRKSQQQKWKQRLRSLRKYRLVSDSHKVATPLFVTTEEICNHSNFSLESQSTDRSIAIQNYGRFVLVTLFRSAKLPKECKFTSVSIANSSPVSGTLLLRISCNQNIPVPCLPLHNLMEPILLTLSGS